MDIRSFSFLTFKNKLSLNLSILSNSLNSHSLEIIQPTSKCLSSTSSWSKSSLNTELNSQLVSFGFLLNFCFYFYIHIYRNWGLDCVIGSLYMLFKWETCLIVSGWLMHYFGCLEDLHFRHGEMCITLDNVYYLLHLSIR